MIAKSFMLTFGFERFRLLNNAQLHRRLLASLPDVQFGRLDY